MKVLVVFQAPLFQLLGKYIHPFNVLVSNKYIHPFNVLVSNVHNPPAAPTPRSRRATHVPPLLLSPLHRRVERQREAHLSTVQLRVRWLVGGTGVGARFPQAGQSTNATEEASGARGYTASKHVYNKHIGTTTTVGTGAPAGGASGGPPADGIGARGSSKSSVGRVG